MSEHVLCTLPPTACTTLLRSADATLPAQNIPRSANHCVARSPIGSLLKTT
jgi:hypothetical protein